MTERVSLRELSAANRADFTRALDGIYEHSPWVAERAWAARPFASAEALRAALAQTVEQAEPAEQLALLRAHPELAGRAAVRGELTELSRQEQGGAGLDRCSPEEFARLTDLNTKYSRRFGFPFIIAVRGHTRASIIEALAQRLANTREQELTEALRQIDRIAAIRLRARLAEEDAATLAP